MRILRIGALGWLVVAACGVGRPAQRGLPVDRDLGTPVRVVERLESDAYPVDIWMHDSCPMTAMLNGDAHEWARSWLASDSQQWRWLWKEMALEPGAPPEVDFSRYVVIGERLDLCSGRWWRPPIKIDAAGFVDQHMFSRYGSAQRAVAVPRALLRETFWWRSGRQAYRFRLPAVPKGDTPPSGFEKPAVAPSLGIVEVPEAGQIALRTLSDGRAVWVARLSEGEVSVLPADRPFGSSRADTWLRTSLACRSGRLRPRDGAGGFDARGAPLIDDHVLHRLMPRHDYAWLDPRRVAVGRPRLVLPGRPMDRESSPERVGPEAPYVDLPPVPLWSAPEGHFVRVDLDLVFDERGAALCKPRDRKSACPPSAPRVEGARGLSYASWHEGPLMVRRRGAGVDVVILLSDEQSGWW